MLASHLNVRKGERRKRLEDGHAFLEREFLKKVWWPAFGTLDGLHPEYEVQDYNDGRRYIDHAYQPGGLRLALEADGFHPHVRDVGRWEHADNLLRDLHLEADGWTVLHFSYDVIMNRTRQAQQLLRQIVWGRESQPGAAELTVEEREVIRWMKRKGESVTPKEIERCIGRSRNTARKLLAGMVNKKLLKPCKQDAIRIREYELTHAGRNALLR